MDVVNATHLRSSLTCKEWRERQVVHCLFSPKPTKNKKIHTIKCDKIFKGVTQDTHWRRCFDHTMNSVCVWQKSNTATHTPHPEIWWWQYNNMAMATNNLRVGWTFTFKQDDKYSTIAVLE